ncbi:hypothetical protein MMC25_006183 [Agyrium rufum]|nr:hypothetical protein [Agyrium rufum]
MANFIKSFGDGGIKLFQIRPESTNLILKGPISDASSDAVLKGTLVLSNLSDFNVKNIRLRLVGYWQLNLKDLSHTKNVTHTEEFLSKEWYFVGEHGQNASHTVRAGNHVWNFEHTIPGDSPETAAGCTLGEVSYRLKATIERGKFKENKVETAKIRLIRSIDPLSLDAAQDMMVENVWSDKVEYTLSTPAKFVLWGSQCVANFRLVPLLKGLKIGEVVTFVTQQIVLEPKPGETPALGSNTTARVATDTFVPSQDQQLMPPDGVTFSRTLSLPSKMILCMQTIDHERIQVIHRLKFVVHLINPDGHTSELRATLPLHLGLTPHLLLNEEDELIDTSEVAVRHAATLTNEVPPLYEDHAADQIYFGADDSHFPSALNTPALSRSQNASHNNLTGLATEAQNNAGAPNPTTLGRLLENIPHSTRRSRASDLNHSRTPSNEQHDPLTPQPDSQSVSRTASTPATRVSSSERGSRGSPGLLIVPAGPVTPPAHLEFPYQQLSRVPSYQTAMRNPAVDPAVNADLPTYTMATSRTSSPAPPATRSRAAGGSGNGSRSGSSSSSSRRRSGEVDALDRCTVNNTRANMRIR